ncbi:unnamed protein product [Ceratitis capitata]|uniref:(Mediterranean fruit fly) hypothetical protein n=1 Tax=Ceratitis capitata TaxID=7213 RepID=A0A811U7E6_CERCA|nr:unnamed protein product [Ceratitis capitata]
MTNTYEHIQAHINASRHIKQGQPTNQQQQCNKLRRLFCVTIDFFMQKYKCVHALANTHTHTLNYICIYEHYSCKNSTYLMAKPHFDGNANSQQTFCFCVFVCAFLFFLLLLCSPTNRRGQGRCIRAITSAKEKNPPQLINLSTRRASRCLYGMLRRIVNERAAVATGTAASWRATPTMSCILVYIHSFGYYSRCRRHFKDNKNAIRNTESRCCCDQQTQMCIHRN